MNKNSLSTTEIPNVLRFSHNAMGTFFEIFVSHEDPVYAEQAAHEAFTELDRLELELSRFIENSDISAINNLSSGESVVVGEDTLRCLQRCSVIWKETNRVFDITIGNLRKIWLHEDNSIRTPEPDKIKWALAHTGMDQIELDEERHLVKVMNTPVQIDVGGFGKGYALDRISELLLEWEINKVLIHGGRSSVLALDAPEALSGWPVSVTNPFTGVLVRTFHLTNRAISGSGLQKGVHIIDPRTGQPAEPGIATWAIAPEAALSDALSTAFLLMKKKEVAEYHMKHPDIGILVLGLDNEKQIEFGL